MQAEEFHIVSDDDQYHDSGNGSGSNEDPQVGEFSETHTNPHSSCQKNLETARLLKFEHMKHPSLHDAQDLSCYKLKDHNSLQFDADIQNGNGLNNMPKSARVCKRSPQVISINSLMYGGSDEEFQRSGNGISSNGASLNHLFGQEFNMRTSRSGRSNRQNGGGIPQFSRSGADFAQYGNSSMLNQSNNHYQKARNFATARVNEAAAVLEETVNDDYLDDSGEGSSDVARAQALSLQQSTAQKSRRISENPSLKKQDNDQNLDAFLDCAINGEGRINVSVSLSDISSNRQQETQRGAGCQTGNLTEQLFEQDEKSEQENELALISFSSQQLREQLEQSKQIKLAKGKPNLISTLTDGYKIDISSYSQTVDASSLQTGINCARNTFLIEDQGDNNESKMSSQDEIEPTISFKQFSESFRHGDTINTEEDDYILNNTQDHHEQAPAAEKLLSPQTQQYGFYEALSNKMESSAHSKAQSQSSQTPQPAASPLPDMIHMTAQRDLPQVLYGNSSTSGRRMETPVISAPAAHAQNMITVFLQQQSSRSSVQEEDRCQPYVPLPNQIMNMNEAPLPALPPLKSESEEQTIQIQTHAKQTEARPADLYQQWTIQQNMTNNAIAIIDDEQCESDGSSDESFQIQLRGHDRSNDGDGSNSDAPPEERIAQYLPVSSKEPNSMQNGGVEETRCRLVQEEEPRISQQFGSFSGLNTISSRVETSQPFEPLVFGREVVHHNQTQAYSPKEMLTVPDILGETSGDGGEPKKSLPQPLFQLPQTRTDFPKVGGFQLSDPAILLNRESSISQPDGGKMSIEFLSPSTQQKKSASLVSLSSPSLALSHTQQDRLTMNSLFWQQNEPSQVFNAMLQQSSIGNGSFAALTDKSGQRRSKIQPQDCNQNSDKKSNFSFQSSGKKKVYSGQKPAKNLQLQLPAQTMEVAARDYATVAARSREPPLVGSINVQHLNTTSHQHHQAATETSSNPAQQSFSVPLQSSSYCTNPGAMFPNSKEVSPTTLSQELNRGGGEFAIKLKQFEPAQQQNRHQHARIPSITSCYLDNRITYNVSQLKDYDSSDPSSQFQHNVQPDVTPKSRSSCSDFQHLINQEGDTSTISHNSRALQQKYSQLSEFTSNQKSTGHSIPVDQRSDGRGELVPVQMIDSKKNLALTFASMSAENVHEATFSQPSTAKFNKMQKPSVFKRGQPPEKDDAKLGSARYEDGELFSQVYSQVVLDDHTTDNDCSAVDQVDTTDVRPSYPGDFLEEFLTEEEIVAVFRSTPNDIPASTVCQKQLSAETTPSNPYKRLTQRGENKSSLYGTREKLDLEVGLGHMKKSKEGELEVILIICEDEYDPNRQMDMSCTMPQCSISTSFIGSEIDQSYLSEDARTGSGRQLKKQERLSPKFQRLPANELCPSFKEHALQRASTWDNNKNEYGLIQNKIWEHKHKKHQSSIHSSTNTIHTAQQSTITHQSFLSRVANKRLAESRTTNQDDNVSPLTPIGIGGGLQPGNKEALKISLTPNPDLRKGDAFASQKEALFIAGPGSTSLQQLPKYMLHQHGCQTTSNEEHVKRKSNSKTRIIEPCQEASQFNLRTRMQQNSGKVLGPGSSKPSENPLLMSTLYKACGEGKVTDGDVSRFTNLCSNMKPDMSQRSSGEFLLGNVDEEQIQVPSDLLQWLRALRLEKYAEVLVESGFDDLSMLVNMCSRDRIMPLTQETLQEVGIRLPGQRMKLLIKLEFDAGVFHENKELQQHIQNRNRPLTHVTDSESTQSHMFSGQKGPATQSSPTELAGTPMSVTFVPNQIQKHLHQFNQTGASDRAAQFIDCDLFTWLQHQNLHSLHPLFDKSGYDDLLSLYMQAYSTLNPLTDKVLREHINIQKVGHRHRILSQLRQDALDFFILVLGQQPYQSIPTLAGARVGSGLESDHHQSSKQTTLSQNQIDQILRDQQQPSSDRDGTPVKTPGRDTLLQSAASALLTNSATVLQSSEREDKRIKSRNMLQGTGTNYSGYSQPQDSVQRHVKYFQSTEDMKTALNNHGSSEPKKQTSAVPAGPVQQGRTSPTCTTNYNIDLQSDVFPSSYGKRMQQMENTETIFSKLRLNNNKTELKQTKVERQILGRQSDTSCNIF